MSEFFHSGRALDLALLVVLGELAMLVGTRAGRRWSATAPDLRAHLWAAVGLLLAAHLTLVHAHWLFSALALAFGGLAHVIGWRIRAEQLLSRRVAADPTFSSRLIS
jgi:hypothetical protein